MTSGRAGKGATTPSLQSLSGAVEFLSPSYSLFWRICTLYRPAGAGSRRQAVVPAGHMGHRLGQPAGSKAADKELPEACNLPAAKKIHQAN